MDEFEVTESELKTFFNLSPVLFCIAGQDGYFKKLSPAWEKVLGWTVEELISQPWIELVHPEDRAASLAIAQTCAKDTTTFESRYRHRDGSYRWLTWNVLQLEEGLSYLIVTDVTEQKQAEAALRKSEATNRALLQAIPDLMIRLNRAGEYIDFCPAADFRTLLPFEAIQGKTIYEVTQPEFAQERMHYVKQALDTGCTQTYEFELQREDGTTTFEEARIAVSGEDEVVVITRDITDRKRAEADLQQLNQQLEARVERRTAELQRTQKFLESILNTLPVGVVAKDAETLRFVLWNATAAEILGFSAQEALGKRSGDLFPSEQASLFTCIDLEALNSKQVLDAPEEKVQTKQGEFKLICARKTAVLDDEGKPQYVLSIFEDVTDRKHRDERLRLLESVVVNANDAVLITEASPIDEPGPRIVYVNQAFTRNTGYCPEEVIGKTPRLLQGAKTDREQLGKIRTALAEWQPVQAELLNYRKDGSEIWVELEIVPIADEQGQFTHWVSVQRDISDRKRAEAEIRRALEQEKELNELKSSFISMVSHEFRTPLSIILSAAEFLKRYDSQLSPEKKLIRFDRIMDGVKRMTQLLTEVLTLSKAEAGQLQFNPVPLDVAEFCHDLVEEIKLVADSQHTILLSGQGASDRVCLDQNLLWHILTNLLSNAIKYSPQNSSIQLEWVINPQEVVFQVQDSGIGIPPADQEQVFTPFYRGSNVYSISGTGLGLAVAKHCVTLHHGTIEAYSESGKGTRFTVKLPLS